MPAVAPRPPPRCRVRLRSSSGGATRCANESLILVVDKGARGRVLKETRPAVTSVRTTPIPRVRFMSESLADEGVVSEHHTGGRRYQLITLIDGGRDEAETGCHDGTRITRITKTSRTAAGARWAHSGPAAWRSQAPFGAAGRTAGTRRTRRITREPRPMPVIICAIRVPSRRIRVVSVVRGSNHRRSVNPRFDLSHGPANYPVDQGRAVHA